MALLVRSQDRRRQTRLKGPRSVTKALEEDPFDAATGKAFRDASAAVLTALRALPDTLPLHDVYDALRGQTPALAALHLDEDAVARAFEPLTAILEGVATRSAREEIAALPLIKEIRQTFDFNLVNPMVVADAQARAAGRVVEISTATRASIRALVAAAVAGEAGGAPMTVARSIRGMVGLHSRWSRAVLNYQLKLESGGMAASKVSSLVSRYYSKLLTSRSRNIARTEIMQAANAGKIASWRTMEGEGWFGNAVVSKQWEAASDAEAICASVDGQIVPLNDLFSTSEGAFDMPPAHPSCRCTATLIQNPSATKPEGPRTFDSDVDGHKFGRDTWGDYRDAAQGTPEWEGMDAYKEFAYNEINATLRGTNLTEMAIGEGENVTTEGIAKYIQQIDAVLDAAPVVPEDVIVSRTMGSRTLTRQFGADALQNPDALVGETFLEKGYTSTSLNPNFYEEWAGSMRGTPIIVDVEVPAGTPGMYLEGALYPGEAELLIARGAQFTITSAEPGFLSQFGDTFDILQLTVKLTGFQPRAAITVIKGLVAKAVSVTKKRKFTWEAGDVEWV